jgi:pimeloyl-ACP methyl ester carboxylesterase
MFMSTAVGRSFEDKMLNINCLDIAIRTWGHDTLHPVLALHGWLDNAATFSRIAPHLENVCVIAPDLAGHGRSDHRRSDVGYYLWDYAIDMDALVRRFGWRRYSILAHSMGTGVASILCSISRGVRNIVFLDGLGAPFTIKADNVAAHIAHSQRAMEMARKSRLYGFSDHSTAQFTSRDEAVDARRKAVRGELSQHSAELLAERDLTAVGSGYRWRHDPRLALPEPMRLTDEQAGRFLSAISCPLHVVLGKSGLFVGKALDEKARYLPHQARIHWHEGGHHFHLENPSKELVAQINDAFSTQ